MISTPHLIPVNDTLLPHIKAELLESCGDFSGVVCGDGNWKVGIWYDLQARDDPPMVRENEYVVS
jgi:hypothetical protein